MAKMWRTRNGQIEIEYFVVARCCEFLGSRVPPPTGVPMCGSAMNHKTQSKVLAFTKQFAVWQSTVIKTDPRKHKQFGLTEDFSFRTLNILCRILRSIIIIIIIYELVWRRYYVSHGYIKFGSVAGGDGNLALKWWTHKIYDRPNKNLTQSISNLFILFDPIQLHTRPVTFSMFRWVWPGKLMAGNREMR